MVITTDATFGAVKPPARNHYPIRRLLAEALMRK
jgi:hypothetical protein